MAAKVKSRIFEIIKEDELKSEYLDRYLDMAIVKLKIYAVCRRLLKTIRGFKTANKAKIDNYLDKREGELINHKYLRTNRVLAKIFLQMNREDLSNNIIDDVYEIFRDCQIDRIVGEFSSIADNVDKSLIDQLLLLNMEVSKFQSDSILEIVELYNYQIDTEIVDSYNAVSGYKRHITRRVLEDIPFYIAYQLVVDDKKSLANIEKSIKESYKNINEWEYDSAKRIVESFKIVTTVKYERFEKFLKLIGGNRK